MNDRWFAIENYPDTITAFADTGFSNDVQSHSKNRYVSVRRPHGVQRARDIETREGVAITAELRAEASSSAGTVTPASSERSQARDRLISLIGQMQREGYSCVEERTSRISQDSAESAKALFELLLPSHRVPQIAPDGEGGLLAVWEDADSPTVLVIDNWRLHLVVAAATPNAKYFDDVPFDGERVPDVVAESIPS
jgi:hypothetical protein